MKVNTNTSVSAQSNYVATEKTSKQEEKKMTVSSSETVKETTPEPGKEAKKDDRAKVEEFVNKVNKQLEHSDTKLQFKVHESEYSRTNKVSIKVIDESNNRVIAEIPSEESIEFAEKMHEIAGVLFDKRN